MVILYIFLLDYSNRMSVIPCACCNFDVNYPSGKKRTDFLKCGCPECPIICGPCRNMKHVIHTCLWCGKNGLARSTRSSQQASYLKAVAKRWETFRKEHPDILSPLAENWCMFVRYDQVRQTIEETMQGFAKMFGLSY
jgi:hypothetical protein